MADQYEWAEHDGEESMTREEELIRVVSARIGARAVDRAGNEYIKQARNRWLALDVHPTDGGRRSNADIVRLRPLQVVP